MKFLRLIFIIPWLSCSTSSSSQQASEPPKKRQEFETHKNGLIYSERTMSSLKNIVDSMNIKYRQCGIWKTFYSVPQALCHHISMDTGNIKGALADIKAGISYEDFIRKYPLAKAEQNLLAIKIAYEDYTGTHYTLFQTIELGKTYAVHIYSKDTSLLSKKQVGQWVFEHYEKSEYQANEYIKALFFPTGFISPAIPERYAKMIQYADCMIDTNASVYIGNTTSGRYEREETGKEIAAFIKYAQEHTQMPQYSDYKDNSDAYYSNIRKWYDNINGSVIAANNKSVEYRRKLNKALAEAYAKKISTEELENFALPLVSKDTILFLKRCRTVIGGCSMDQAPRLHAIDIAKLSAEAVNWEIFLRSHLDVMNDNFERVTDGSYAWGERQTYIGELEALDIDVTTLLLGISLRMDNPAGNHYFGSIGRIGRAMSESAHRPQIEELMSSIIRDRNLDDYNRILIYYLYRNYLHYLKDDNDKKNSMDKLKSAVTTLPGHYTARISFNEED